MLSFFCSLGLQHQRQCHKNINRIEINNELRKKKIKKGLRARMIQVLP
jgi:hypothetical protein